MAEKMCCLKRGGGHGMANFEQLHATTQNIYIYVHIYIYYLLKWDFSFMLVAYNQEKIHMIWYGCVAYPPPQKHAYHNQEYIAMANIKIFDSHPKI